MSFLEVKPLHTKESSSIPKNVIGLATCPVCGKEDLFVINNGRDGHARTYSLENHNMNEKDELCTQSGKYTPISIEKITMDV